MVSFYVLIAVIAIVAVGSVVLMYRIKPGSAQKHDSLVDRVPRR